ncbi:MAG: DUF3795 domain-containing protein [Clostridia bacterium]|nr:DUF3795 domain-containing protein [Clostridia bacterium]
MLGYCGINCHECKAYKGTVHTDLDLLKSAGENYLKGQYKPEDWVCLGCTPANQKFIAKYCRECVVRKCAVEKKVQNCAECDSYESCDTIQNFINDFYENVETNELLIRMNLLRKRFVDSN